ncbi:MAG: TonB-dependent siderophore receptor [Bacteroidota bacterium]
MNRLKTSFATLFPLLLLLVGTQSMKAQTTGSIHGSVTDTSEEPLPGFHVRLEPSNMGGTTDRTGSFELLRVEPGSYQVVVTGIGFETERTTIDLDADETLHLQIELNPAEEVLESIVVRSERIQRYDRNRSLHVGKMPMNRLQNPQSYISIPSELLEDQVVTRLDDALKNASGLVQLWESTGRGGDGTGYYSLRGFAVQPTMINGLPSLTHGSLDPAGIETIEVIKGPSGALYGGSQISYGGLINVVTKKPYNRFGGDVRLQSGSFGFNRAVLDLNTPIRTEEGDLSIRTVGSYHREESFQDAGHNESIYLAPSLSYEPNRDLRFLVQTEMYSSEKTNPTMLFLNRSQPLSAQNLDELSYDPFRSYTSDDLTIENPAYTLQGSMEYQLSDNWQLQSNLSRSSARSNGHYSYLWDLATPDLQYSRFINWQNATTIGTNLQQNLLGELELGATHHHLLVGLDYTEERSSRRSTGYIGYDVIELGEEDAYPLTRQQVDAQLEGASASYATTRQQTYSAYLSDRVDLFPDLSLLASLRVDHFRDLGHVDTSNDGFEQTALSPKAGIVYQLLEERISLFGNWQNGFSNVAPRAQQDGSTKTFRPEKAHQMEAGVKTQLLENRLQWTVSAYRILVSDVVREDPNRAQFYIQDGENKSRGIETSLSASLNRSLHVNAGYSYNESDVVKTDNADYRGRRPEEAGPRHLAHAWASYQTQSGWLQNLGFGFGGNYFGKNPILNRASTGTFTLPAYTILNGSIFYEQDRFRIDVKVNNLADKTYYNGWSTVNPQRPRHLLASFTYRF